MGIDFKSMSSHVHKSASGGGSILAGKKMDSFSLVDACIHTIGQLSISNWQWPSSHVFFLDIYSGLCLDRNYSQTNYVDMPSIHMHSNLYFLERHCEKDSLPHGRSKSNSIVLLLTVVVLFLCPGLSREQRCHCCRWARAPLLQVHAVRPIRWFARVMEHLNPLLRLDRGCLQWPSATWKGCRAADELLQPFGPHLAVLG